MTLTLKTELFKIIDGDYVPSSDFESEVSEHDGSFYEDIQYVDFDVDGINVGVTYSLCVDGHTFYDGGDYFTPPYSCIDIDNVDIDVTEVLINETPVELTPQLSKLFEKIIEEKI